jgi:hypothetical protein
MIKSFLRKVDGKHNRFRVINLQASGIGERLKNGFQEKKLSGVPLKNDQSVIGVLDNREVRGGA